MAAGEDCRSGGGGGYAEVSTPDANVEEAAVDFHSVDADPAEIAVESFFDDGCAAKAAAVVEVVEGDWFQNAWVDGNGRDCCGYRTKEGDKNGDERDHGEVCRHIWNQDAVHDVKQVRCDATYQKKWQQLPHHVQTTLYM
jgi:hypothetical protein